VDAEFGKLIEHLDAGGVLDKSYIILTSDHGEMFERGFDGHGGLMMYEPVLRIPLLIHAPGQVARNDVRIPTSNIDVLPTILSLAAKEIPEGLEGQLLAGLGGEEDQERPIFSMCAWQNSAFRPIKKAALSMRKGVYKLIAYIGYGGDDGIYELYDLENDPEELHELSMDVPPVFSRMKEEFLTHLTEANRPFEP
jgi:choline-sulfatase